GNSARRDGSRAPPRAARSRPPPPGPARPPTPPPFPLGPHSPRRGENRFEPVRCGSHGHKPPGRVVYYQCGNGSRAGSGNGEKPPPVASAALDLPVQPGAGVNPLALGGGGGDAERPGGLLQGQAGEVA